MPSELIEGHIAFAPTFKRKPFDNSSFGIKRNPAWTDRILYYCASSNEQECPLQLKSYDSNNMLNMSDHRPVFAQFLLGLDLTNQGSEMEDEELNRDA